MAITAPYMHDGSIATLEAVIGHPAVAVDFLRCLTDEALLKDGPWRSLWERS